MAGGVTQACTAPLQNVPAGQVTHELEAVLQLEPAGQAQLEPFHTWPPVQMETQLCAAGFQVVPAAQVGIGWQVPAVAPIVDL